jgi:transposase InsO family protein
MDSRLCFVAACLIGAEPMSALCLRYGISRKTGYKWLDRYRALGAAGLADHSSARLTHPAGLAPSVKALILALRDQRPSWGPHKLLARLVLDHPGVAFPAPSTLGDLLAREGRVVARLRRPRQAATTGPLAEPLAANDSWAADFKGWWRTADGVRCEPLTITDGYSRFLLVNRAVARPTFADIRPVFIEAFTQFGLPGALRTDNGSPFANRLGLAGLTQFSVWLLTLNIWPDRIAPGRPDQNGRHERMHRTLAEEAADRRCANIPAQQAKLDAWRDDFNTQRPHQALGQRCPASLYTPSPRAYRQKPEAWSYPADHQVRRVRADGYIPWQDKKLYLTEALIGETVALARCDDGDWMVRFRNFDITKVGDESGKLIRSGLARTG